jgi:prevent-host-death family protein
MARSVSATQAKLKFGEILADVSFGKNHVVIEKQGKGLAVIIPIDDYQDYQRLKNEEERFSRQEVLQQIIDFRKSLPTPPPDTPDAVQILRELRQRDRFS